VQHTPPVVQPKINKGDILLYISLPLVAKVYKMALHNLGYNVKNVANEQEFLDKLEEGKYKYAIYDDKAFPNQVYLVYELIEDSSVIPLLLTSNVLEEIPERFNVLKLDVGIDMLKVKLEKIFN